jgi:hypothetical protein
MGKKPNDYDQRIEEIICRNVPTPTLVTVEEADFKDFTSPLAKFLAENLNHTNLHYTFVVAYEDGEQVIMRRICTSSTSMLGEMIQELINLYEERRANNE